MNETERQFAGYFEGCQHDLLRYILGCVHRHSDALDILQETAAALWLKFDEYDPQRPFGAWARKFAHVQVLKFCLYRKREKQNLLAFSEQTQTALAKEYDEHEDVLAARSQALASCMEELQAEDRTLLKQRYFESGSMRQMAEKSGKNEDQLYRRLNAIRKALMKCIDFRLTEQGWT